MKISNYARVGELIENRERTRAGHDAIDSMSVIFVRGVERMRHVQIAVKMTPALKALLKCGLDDRVAEIDKELAKLGVVPDHLAQSTMSGEAVAKGRPWVPEDMDEEPDV